MRFPKRAERIEQKMQIELPEIVAIGIYNTQSVVRNKDVTKNRKTDMFEIEMPIEKGGISYIDEQFYPIDPHRMICAKPGQIRHTKLPYKCYYIHMIVKEGTLRDILMQIPSFIPIATQERYESTFIHMQKLFEKGLEEDALLLQSELLALIHALHTEAAAWAEKNCGTSVGKEITEILIPYIRENITADLSLAALANKVHLSPNYLHNRFKASTGKTLRDFVEEVRIKAAVNLLVSTSLTLTEIAYRCGFSSQSYFSMVFKRRMHQTPRDYVKEESARYFKLNRI